MVPISANLSRLDFMDEDVCDKIMQLVKAYDIAPWMIKIEITESAYTENSQQIIDITHKLGKNGFQVMMDDFGSGYSSLNMLKDVPVDVLKVDMKFIEGLEQSKRGANILVSVTRMAKILDMDVVAEGVETKYQYEFVKRIGCDMIQGYYFSKPLEEEEYSRLMEESAKKKVEDGQPQKKAILIVDDSPTVRHGLKLMLQEDFDVYEASNGREALDFLERRECTVSLVLTDIMMPEMDGLAFVTAMKKDMLWRNIPVMILSDIHDEEVIKKGIAIGAMDFIHKTFDRDILLHKVHNMVRFSDMELLYSELQHLKMAEDAHGLYRQKEDTTS